MQAPQDYRNTMRFPYCLPRSLCIWTKQGKYDLLHAAGHDRVMNWPRLIIPRPLFIDRRANHYGLQDRANENRRGVEDDWKWPGQLRDLRNR